VLMRWQLVSCMPAAQFGDECSWVRGTELIQGSSGSSASFWLMYDVFKYPRGYAYTRLNTTALKHKYFASTFGQVWVTVRLRWVVSWGSHYVRPGRQTGRYTDSSIPVIFNLFCSHTPTCNVSSTLCSQKMLVYISSYTQSIVYI
jgi:hypothetical protein